MRHRGGRRVLELLSEEKALVLSLPRSLSLSVISSPRQAGSLAPELLCLYAVLRKDMPRGEAERGEQRGSIARCLCA